MDEDDNDYELLQGEAEGGHTTLPLMDPEAFNAEGEYNARDDGPIDPMAAYHDSAITDYHTAARIDDDGFNEDVESWDIGTPSSARLCGRSELELWSEDPEPWALMVQHMYFYEPAYAHYRQDEHRERHYIQTASGAIPSRYEQVRVRNVLRKLRADNPEYYRAQNRKHDTLYAQKNREKRAEASKKSWARLSEADRKAQRNAKQRRYRARQKLLKQQQQILTEQTT